MSNHKPKHPENNPGPKKNKDDGDKETTKRHVYVEPGVKIDLVQDLKDKYETAQTDSSTHNDKQLLWTKIGAALVLIYAAITLWMAISNQRTADSAVIDQRPYVVVNNPGNLRTGLIPDTDLQADIPVKNVGRTPAVRIHHFSELVYFPPPDYSGHSPEEYAIAFQSRFLDDKFQALEQRDIGERSILEPLHGEDDMSPGGDFFIVTDTLDDKPFTLTKDQIAQVKSPQGNGGALFIIGLITYTDKANLDKAAYRTDFCWFFVGDDPKIWRRCRFHQLIR